MRPQRVAGMFFVSPAMLHFLTFTTLPVLGVLLLSFTDYSVIRDTHWVGLRNYQDLGRDEVFWTALRNTFAITFVSLPVSMALALAMAVVLNEPIRGRVFYRAAFYLPKVTATIAIATVWLWIYSPQFGLLNSGLRSLGLRPVDVLGNPDTALYGVVAVYIWRTMGAKMVIFLAGLQAIPIHLYEAARIDGAGRWHQFTRITLPLLAPATFFVLVTGMLDVFKVFEEVYVMTNGGPVHATTTIAHQVYLQGFQYFRMGYAGAQAVIMFGAVVVLTALNRLLFREKVDYA